MRRKKHVKESVLNLILWVQLLCRLQATTTVQSSFSNDICIIVAVNSNNNKKTEQDFFYDKSIFSTNFPWQRTTLITLICAKAYK